jgi:pyruvate,water dikinase
MLEFGRRLAAAGVLDRADEIFYLNFDETRTTAEALPRLDKRHVVAGRRAEMEYFRGVLPPPALGEPPPGPPPVDPLSRAINRFFGFGTPSPSPADPNVLKGNAGSPGVARGPARVVHSLAESGKLQAGDVLVAETTMPAWTPLFATAAAVVTDTGGVLSHCAVVAREYRIPAVVGARTATSLIHDGQLLEVNGSTGVVQVMPTT